MHNPPLNRTQPSGERATPGRDSKPAQPGMVEMVLLLGVFKGQDKMQIHMYAVIQIVFLNRDGQVTAGRSGHSLPAA
jgi:hypothetical protein